MTNLVEAHPLVQAADAKWADLERRRADFEAYVAPLAAAVAEEEQAYNVAVDAALLQGKPMLEPQVRRVPLGRDVELRHVFMEERHQLNEQRLKAVAAAYDDVLSGARKQAKLTAAALAK